ncbi:hypothetical protein NC796_01035 [Aliifodinibius sp. S!AR15-10]|uniref:four-carbon acid sugar kinase family protein n=1 Tax=Aliifodinibius sp. S!AR15-10 TaxID=2950437 RepID=UPI00285710BB|nr:four-carbon acid sugar kinase family protein [Aliifodinibius sp. S!AR15-10]MDR8389700.1 hypothetical protein [Aliifodinibius sp. S!AR15-10]
MSIQQEIENWINESPGYRLSSDIREANKKLNRSLVVLDDDPTGTQTVHDLPVITSGDVEQLTELFREKYPLFYVLTNSRSLDGEDAAKLITTIAHNLRTASVETGRDYNVVLRSDSTLRGHHPEEMDAILDVIEKVPDLKVLHPAFIEGGRLTFNSTHYAKEDGQFIPCSETEYAQDATFGYKSSHLVEWLNEKTGGDVTDTRVTCFPINVIRNNSIQDLVLKIIDADKGNYLIADAVSYHDIDKFALALLKSNRSFVARTAASFVASIGGIEQRSLLTHAELAYKSGNGGLIIAGSYVDKTTRQINKVIEQGDVKPMVIDVKRLLQHHDPQTFLIEWVDSIQTEIQNNQDLLVYTSREVIIADNAKENLDIGNKISTFISDLVGTLTVTPSFLIAKGGITSSDIATKSLNVKKAQVMGQIIPGIPVWKLGKESKYPGMPYIIFPGNVGGDEALLTAIRRIKGKLTK